MPVPDTTSHNWVFDPPVLLGGAQSSALYDVAIVNDTLAYAVGEIYVDGETTRYNLARWGGDSWTLARVPYVSDIDTFYHPIQTLITFSSNDVWFAGNGLIRWNGSQYLPMEIPMEVWGAYSVNKIWGTSSANLYLVGDGGSFAHFNGTSWQKLESGTNLHFYDIWGDAGEVYAVAANQTVNFDKKIFRIQGTSIDTVSTNGIPYSLQSIWFTGAQRYFVAGDGIFAKQDIETSTPWEALHEGVTVYHSYSIRGNAHNDVFVCGSFGELLHWNGLSWTSFRAITAIAQGTYYAIALRDDLMITVGYDNPNATVVVGRRE
ncbi:MAG: hypothetical protein WEF53_02965 [Bacteroidota bacterium]